MPTTGAGRLSWETATTRRSWSEQISIITSDQDLRETGETGAKLSAGSPLTPQRTGPPNKTKLMPMPMLFI
jgi:hypothetical protein